MNAITAIIENISTSGSISRVVLRTPAKLRLQLYLIERPETAPYLKIGKEVKAFFKENELIIGTEEHTVLSIPNKIPATITAIDSATLMSRIFLQSEDGPLSALIDTERCKTLNLQKSQKIYVFIKMNEIMLST